MDKLLTDIMEISDEERKILDKYKCNNKVLYSDVNIYGVQKHKFLIDTDIIGIRRHARFVEVPLHKHDFLEIMYVYNGIITHHVDGLTIPLQQGEILFLNRHIYHSIDCANIDDIGINFIISDDFLLSILKNGNSNDIINRFICNDLDKNGTAEFLQYRIGNIFPINNLLKNIIYALSDESKADYALLPQLLSLFFKYLSLHNETLFNSNTNFTENDIMKKKIFDYISENYKTASLTELAHNLDFSYEYLCRRIIKLFNMSFVDLLSEQRFAAAKNLLSSSNMKISEIISSVGYENTGYFFRKFKTIYGITPNEWRSTHFNMQN